MFAFCCFLLACCLLAACLLFPACCLVLVFVFVRFAEVELPLGIIYQRLGRDARGLYFTFVSATIPRVPGSREWLCRGVNCIWRLHSRGVRDFTRPRPSCQKTPSDLRSLPKNYVLIPPSLLSFTFLFTRPYTRPRAAFFVTELTFSLFLVL